MHSLTKQHSKGGLARLRRLKIKDNDLDGNSRAGEKKPERRHKNTFTLIRNACLPMNKLVCSLSLSLKTDLDPMNSGLFTGFV